MKQSSFSFLSYFKSTFIFSILGLVLAAVIGFYYSGHFQGALNALFVCSILGVLETSLSFDNAVVNASVLKQMSPLWQHRFLTWGMFIAVFGMRIVFPLLIVAIVGHLGPIEALRLALFSPVEYATVMLSAEHEISAFGGAFLLLVALKYFFNREKTVHWIRMLEKPLAKMGKLEAVEVGITLVVIYGMSHLVKPGETITFLYAGIAGVLTFLMVDAVSVFLHVPEATQKNIHRASLGLFLYLEVLDASFSFDGVIGAFAISHNLFIIAIGLGIGALFVRSLTILMVDRGTLDSYLFLEHGAFYALGALALIMFLNTIAHVPELVSGLVGAFFIGFAIWSSIRTRKKTQSSTRSFG